MVYDNTNQTMPCLFVVSPSSSMHLLYQVLCDRHFGGINYPVGGVGGIAKALANGLVEKGGKILYKANVTNIILENGKAVSNFSFKLNFNLLITVCVCVCV